jgi:membrane-associated phospholipid phosphatase
MLSLPLQTRWIVLSMIFFTTFIIPGLGAYTMVRSGKLDSMEMEKREQRGLPLLFTGVCYVVMAYMLHRTSSFDPIFYFVMAIMAASVFLTYIISLFWKVSAHSVGMGGSLGLLLVLNRMAPEAHLLFPIALVLMLSGAVMSARLALHVHTPAQVYAGFGSGLLLAVTAALFAI